MKMVSQSGHREISYLDVRTHGAFLSPEPARQHPSIRLKDNHGSFEVVLFAKLRRAMNAGCVAKCLEQLHYSAY